MRFGLIKYNGKDIRDVDLYRKFFSKLKNQSHIFWFLCKVGGGNRILYCPI